MPTTTPIQLQLKNILVPVDFSSRSDRAVKLARALAQQHGAMVHLANVIETFDVAGTSRHSTRKLDLEKAMTDFGSIEKHLGATKHTRVVLDGDVNACLLGAIEERDIDLVVMTTGGIQGCERLLMGSVTEELFREAPCPVLAVGPKAADQYSDFPSFSKVLYPMEITPSSIAAVPYVVGLAHRYGTRLTLLHVVHPDIQSPSERQRMRERISSELRTFFPESLQQSIDTVVEFGPVAETVVEFALSKRADVVVLGVRSGGAFTRSSTHILWSIAHRIIAEAPCPVLTIRNSGD